jgi:hypothetical protein
MSSIFAGIPDADLSELDRAERDWHILSETHERVVQTEIALIMQIAASDVLNNSESSVQRKQEATAACLQRMNDAKVAKHTAWVNWVILKPYVSEEMKKKKKIRN